MVQGAWLFGIGLVARSGNFPVTWIMFVLFFVLTVAIGAYTQRQIVTGKWFVEKE